MFEIIGWYKKCVQNALNDCISTRFNGFSITSGAFQRSASGATGKFANRSFVHLYASGAFLFGGEFQVQHPE
jgi:hypothetical protein